VRYYSVLSYVASACADGVARTDGLTGADGRSEHCTVARRKRCPKRHRHRAGNAGRYGKPDAATDARTPDTGAVQLHLHAGAGGRCRSKPGPGSAAHSRNRFE
jgi:hypothetical protein